jgi:hypothetical protein
MMPLFRKIRQNLLRQNRVTRYLAYAIGEIFLVVIGILIALQVNNANQQRIEKAEKANLVILLKEELNENLKAFETSIAYLEGCRKKSALILEVSTGKNRSIPIDSIREYTIRMLPVLVGNINSSRLTSSKESGKFSLLNGEESKAMTEYESNLLNYQEARNQTSFLFKEDGNELMIRFNPIKDINRIAFGEENLLEHPSLALSDQDLIPYIQLPDTYRLVYRNYIDLTTQILWLRELTEKINSALEILDKENHD